MKRWFEKKKKESQYMQKKLTKEKSIYEHFLMMETLVEFRKKMNDLVRFNC